jgi:hypothetical protein
VTRRLSPRLKRVFSYLRRQGLTAHDRRAIAAANSRLADPTAGIEAFLLLTAVSVGGGYLAHFLWSLK